MIDFKGVESFLGDANSFFENIKDSLSDEDKLKMEEALKDNKFKSEIKAAQKAIEEAKTKLSDYSKEL